MLLCVLLIFTQFEGNTAADGIYPLSSEKHVLEGADVTFSCNYSAALVQGSPRLVAGLLLLFVSQQRQTNT
ncbi:hypothetical protein MHYP_G00362670 [Metynnis hypsauchen]